YAKCWSTSGNLFTYDLGIVKLTSRSLTSPPQVASLVVNGGAAPRSRVTSIGLDFDSVISFAGSPEGAFSLTRQSDNAAIKLSAAVSIDTATHVTLTFSGAATEFGSLADGVYTLTVLAGKVSDVNGALDGDGDGTGGDDYVAVGSPTADPKLFRLFGDFNGSGSVDGVDFLAFRSTLGLASGAANFNPAFDFDGNGTTDAQDFLELRSRFGQGQVT